jgi:ParB-like chromosome segregation protein Spo0J
MKSFKDYITEAKKQSMSIDDVVPWQEHHSEKGVEHYRKKIQSGKSIKPIKVIPHETQKGKYSIADGHHRYLAHKQENLKTIDVSIYKRLADVPDNK